MKRLGVLLGLCAVLMVCKSPPPADSYQTEGAAVPGSLTVSRDVYDYTLLEVRQFIDNLNVMIQKKDYNGWKAALSDEFFARISSPEFLASASESAVLKSRKIVLKTPNDYFLQVVVPSRNNSRADEIEFTADHTIKVFYREERVRKNDNASTTEVRRLRLYELVKTDGSWKIID